MKWISAIVLLCVTAPLWAQQQSVVDSAHNLSAGGPNRIRSSGEAQVCIFCHTPHNATPIQPLWNRNVPVTAYKPYSSNSLQATPGQPTGTSKLCLSCHDGTIALGSVVNALQPIHMAGGITTLPPGASNLGTDLSDDHPISFRYDAALVTKNPKLKNPAALPHPVRLDAGGELQCTSCHDAHDNTNGNFLVMSNANSQLCNSCHTQGTTPIESHTECSACHVPHTAPSGAYLLKAQTTTATCTTCHNGQPGNGANVLADLNKVFRHDTNVGVNVKQHAPANVGCSDCHESHTMGTGVAVAPNLTPSLGAIDGVNAGGAAVKRAQFNYEVCFKCHADQNAVPPRVTRQIAQNNTRLEFDPSAVSYHPVEAPGRNSDVPSLRPGLTSGSLIYCVDCHASDTAKTNGGSGANGPHGSTVRGMLAARYETADGTTESADAYALCYKCHQRSAIIAPYPNPTVPRNDTPFPQHTSHVVDYQASCSVCHDAHGISAGQGMITRNSRLINFDTSIVTPDPTTGRLEYVNQGPRAGSCFLSCHGKVHSGLAYPTDEPRPIPTPALRFQRTRAIRPTR